MIIFNRSTTTVRRRLAKTSTLVAYLGRLVVSVDREENPRPLRLPFTGGGVVPPTPTHFSFYRGVRGVNLGRTKCRMKQVSVCWGCWFFANLKTLQGMFGMLNNSFRLGARDIRRDGLAKKRGSYNLLALLPLVTRLDGVVVARGQTLSASGGATATQLTVA